MIYLIFNDLSATGDPFSLNFCQHILVPLISMVFETFSHVGTKWGDIMKRKCPYNYL